MAKILKLVGLKTHISTQFNALVTKGQTIRVDNDVAAKLKAGRYLDSANNEHSYWKELNEGEVDVIDHDFTTKPAEPVEPEVPVTKRATRGTAQRSARATK